MGSRKEIRDALEELMKQEDGAISDVLERYLSRVAVTGITLYPWSKLKPLIIRKLNMAVDSYNKDYPMEMVATSKNGDLVSVDDMRKRLLDAIELFNGIPFTIQRLCELLTDPNTSKQYRKVDKFMRGIEKNLNVVTTVDPFGNRIVGDPKSASNGVLSMEEDCLMTPTTCTPVKTPSSWFSSLSSVVNSPDSYPNWKQSQEEQQKQQDGVTSSSPAGRKTSRAEDDESDPDLLPSPNKLFRPGDDRNDKVDVKEGGDPSGGSPTTFTPLLSQLLNGSTSLSSSEKEAAIQDGCDSTEGTQRSGLLDILTGNLKEEEKSINPGEESNQEVTPLSAMESKDEATEMECETSKIIGDTNNPRSETPTHISGFQNEVAEQSVTRGDDDSKADDEDVARIVEGVAATDRHPQPSNDDANPFNF